MISPKTKSVLTTTYTHVLLLCFYTCTYVVIWSHVFDIVNKDYTFFTHAYSLYLTFSLSLSLSLSLSHTLFLSLHLSLSLNLPLLPHMSIAFVLMPGSFGLNLLYSSTSFSMDSTSVCSLDLREGRVSRMWLVSVWLRVL